MFDGQMILPIVGQGLVELGVLLIRDVVWVASPDWLGLVEFLELGVLFLLFLFALVDLLDFGLVGVLVFVLGIFLLGLDLTLLLDMELDWVANELGVFLDDLLDFFS